VAHVYLIASDTAFQKQQKLKWFRVLNLVLGYIRLGLFNSLVFI